jgi:hypothetical protein
MLENKRIRAWYKENCKIPFVYGINSDLLELKKELLNNGYEQKACNGEFVKM